MCFSTVASFGAGALLTGISLGAARKSQGPAWAFASIPGIFAVQQFSEGFVWLALSNELYAGWGRAATFMFLFFAEGLWPLWIPLAMLLLEKERWRRQVLSGLLGLGLLLSFYSLYFLLTRSFSAQISEHHIQYMLHYPSYWFVFVTIVYGIVTVLPTFISSISRMWMIGLPIAVSFLVAKALYPNYIISIWCYFAAIISILIIFVLSPISEKLSKAVITQ
jgi:hypothetical protein